jgi:hypothetical protein
MQQSNPPAKTVSHATIREANTSSATTVKTLHSPFAPSPKAPLLHLLPKPPNSDMR